MILHKEQKIFSVPEELSYNIHAIPPTRKNIPNPSPCKTSLIG